MITRASTRAIFAVTTLLLMAAATLTAATAYLVVPPGLEATEGNNAASPGSGIFEDGGQYQLLVNASLFGIEPVQISAISFRAKGFFANGTTFTFDSTLTLQLSVVGDNPADYEGGGLISLLGTGSSAVTVVDGAVLLSDTVTDSGSVQSFDTTINFGTIYNYDPSEGNLLVHFTNFGASVTSPFTFFDAHSGIDGVAGILSSGGNAFIVAPLVAQFTLVPEPGAGMVALIGAGGLLAFSRRSRRFLVSQVRSFLVMVG